jgi:hypothetical protein
VNVNPNKDPDIKEKARMSSVTVSSTIYKPNRILAMAVSSKFWIDIYRPIEVLISTLANSSSLELILLGSINLNDLAASTFKGIQVLSPASYV